MTTNQEKCWFPHRPEFWPFHFATVNRPVDMAVWNGHGADPEFTRYTIPAGTKVRVVMASRFGDVGITDKLERERGYDARIDPEDLTAA